MWSVLFDQKMNFEIIPSLSTLAQINKKNKGNYFERICLAIHVSVDGTVTKVATN